MIELKQSWRVRFLWEVMRMGAIIGGSKVIIDGYYGENVSATIEYGWWYRPVVAFALWLSPVAIIDTPAIEGEKAGEL